MINYETVLSSFDDKMTLMQWLQKVEEALQGAGLVSVTVTQNTPTTCVLKFNFADGSSVTSASISLPKGDKGDKGDKGNTGDTGNGISSISKTGTSGLVDTYTITYTNGNTQTFTVTNGANGQAGADGQDGVGISNVTIQVDGSLIITLTNSNTIDAGNVYNIVTIDLTGGYSGTLSASDLALVKLSNTVIIDNNLKAYKYEKERVISASQTNLVYGNIGVDDYSVLLYSFFEIDEELGAWTWNEGSPYVEYIKSTGASNGQVLTADGSGGASWQNASGGSQLYMHCINISTSKIQLNVTIINDNNTPINTRNLFAGYLHNFGLNKQIMATGMYNESSTVKRNIIGVQTSGFATSFNVMYFDDSAVQIYTESNTNTYTDNIITL